MSDDNLRVTVPVVLESYDPEVKTVLSGSLSLHSTAITLDLEDGRKIAIDQDENGLKVYAWTAEQDPPVFLTVIGDTVRVDHEDFVDEGGTLLTS